MRTSPTSRRSTSAQRSEDRDPLAPSRVLDQRREPALPSLLPFGADHPPCGVPSEPRRQRLPERPSCPVLPESRRLIARELRVRAQGCISPGALLVAPLERPLAGRVHPAFGDQLSGARDVDRAPVALRRSRREPVHVPLLVDAVPDAVDPSEAQRLVEGLAERDALLPRSLLVEADRDLALACVVALEPPAEFRRGAEVTSLHRAPRYPLGISLVGSQCGICTTFAATRPDFGVSTWSSVPSSVNSIGSIARPMFFSSRGEWHAEVTRPTSRPSA